MKFEAGESVIKPSWEQTDVIRIISETGKSETYSIKEINGKTATFEEMNSRALILLRYIPEIMRRQRLSATFIHRSGSNGQRLDGASSAQCDGYRAYRHQQYLFAGEGVKLNGAVKLYVKLPEYVANPKEVSLSAASDLFFTDNAGSAKSSSLGLSLENVDISTDHIFTAYLMSSWTEASIEAGTELTLTVKAEGVSIKKTFTVEKA